MLKQECRDIFKTKRIQLSEEEVELYNEQILTQLKSFDWSRYKRIHIFLSIAKFKEPDTLAFISWIKKCFPLIELVISKSDFNTGTMKNYLYDDSIVLEENDWGIPEPESGILVKNETIDLVLVPMLICDQAGNRVGFGKGFYDRFLSECRADVVTIGISFFEPVEQIEDISPWDYKLDFCITPKHFYSFHK